jgi:multidrug resistance efflux pump
VKKTIVIGLMLGLLVAAGGAVWYFNPFGRHTTTLRLPGTVEIQEIRLGSKLGGRIKSVSVREGQTVKANDEIARFETPELDAQNEQLKAKVAAAQSELDKAEKGPRDEEKDEARAAVAVSEARWQKVDRGWREEEKRAAKNELDAADADLVQTRAEFARLEKLAHDSPGAVTKTDFDNARANRDRAYNRWLASQARYDMMMNGSREEDKAEATAEVARTKAKLALLMAGTRPEDKALARAQLADARAKLEENEANRREAIVRAPGRAVIEVLSVRTGDLLAPNATVARILSADDLWVKVFVPETELGKVRLGQKVEVMVDSYPGQHFPGTVDQIANQSEFTPRNVQSADERKHQVFAIKVKVDNRDGIFKSGMAADVILTLAGAP